MSDKLKSLNTLKPLTQVEKQRCLRLIIEAAREIMAKHGVELPDDEANKLRINLDPLFDRVPVDLVQEIRLGPVLKRCDDASEATSPDERLKGVLGELVKDEIERMLVVAHGRWGSN